MDSKKREKKVKESELIAEEIKEEAKAEGAKAEDNLHPTLQKKKERREAKAARKAANYVEEQKKRPNNILLAILIFGILIAMFVFVACYNYYQKPVSLEKYFEDNGYAEMYKDMPYDEYTQLKLKTSGNDIKINMEIKEDAPDDAVEKFKGEEGLDEIKEIGSFLLTTYKPETRGFGATAEVVVKKGDETINEIKMNYSEAKKYAKEIQKKYEEEHDHEHEEGEEHDHEHEEGEEHEHEHEESEEHDHEHEEGEEGESEGE